MKNLIGFTIRLPGIIFLSAIFIIMNNCSKPYEYNSGSGGGPAPFSYRVSVGIGSFTPEKLSISVNDSVRWENNSQFETYRIICDSANFTGTIRPGEFFAYVFRKPGIFEYRSNKPGMKGYVEVY